MKLLDNIKRKLSRAPAQGETERGTKPEPKAPAAKPSFTIHDLIRRGVPKAPQFSGPKPTNRVSRCGPKSKRGAPVPAEPRRSAGGYLWVSRMPCPRDPKTGAPKLDEWRKGVSAKRLKQPVKTEQGNLRFYEPLLQGAALRQSLKAA